MADKALQAKMALIPEEVRTEIKKGVIIQSIDLCWKEHLQTLDFLKGSIGLRLVAQQNPLTAYKQEAFRLFEGLLSRVRERVTKIMAFAEFQIKQPDPQPVPPPPPANQAEPTSGTPRAPFDRAISRNAPCPCGSGKKYKHCCGKLT